MYVIIKDWCPTCMNNLCLDNKNVNSIKNEQEFEEKFSQKNVYEWPVSTTKCTSLVVREIN